MTPYEKQEIMGLPDKYRPLTAWAYFGYAILFSIPFIGFICLIVFSFSSSNINRRRYARSYFCFYILLLIVVVALLVSGLGVSLVSYITGLLK